MEIKPGQKYRHYKGDTYNIITKAFHSENEEPLVVYERLTDIAHTGWRVYARPEHMFFDHIETDTYTGPRFEYLEG